MFGKAIIDSSDDPRLLIAIRLERSAYIARYLAYSIVLVVFLAGAIQGSVRDLIVVTVVLLLHSVFVHWALWTRRYHLFRTPLNFAIYLVEASLVVYFTGSEESDMFYLYLLLLLGYTANSPGLRGILLVTTLCCFAYLVVIGVEWFVAGIRIPPRMIIARFASIPMCGWLLGSLRELLQQAEKVFRPRKQAVAASESALRRILDSVAEPIIVYDEDDSITEVNNAAAEFVGVPRERLLGQRINTLLFDDGTVSVKLDEVRERGEYHGEQVFVNAEGEELTVEVHVRSFMLERRRFFVVIAYDITERKKQDEAARLAEADLAKLNRELQQLNEMKTGLLATVSRKLRAPLCAVLGYTELLLADELGELTHEQRRALQACRETTLRVFNLMDEYLDFVHTGPAQDEAATAGAKEEQEA